MNFTFFDKSSDSLKSFNNERDMAKNNELVLKSNKAAAAALFALIPIFITVVTIGWRQILDSLIVIPEAGDFETYVKLLVALIIALIGVILARGVATERRRIKKKIDTGVHGTWIAYFFVLVMISALGTINTFFMWSESKAVLTEMIDRTEHYLRVLKSTVISNISTPLYDGDVKIFTENRSKVDASFQELKGDFYDLKMQRKAAVDKQADDADVSFNNFIREATNPQRKGFGPEARRLFGELQTKLPIQSLSGSMSGFNEAMVSAYAQAFKDAKRTAFNIDTTICALTDRARQELKKLQDSVPSIESFETVSCGRIDEKIKDIQTRIELEFARQPRISESEKTKIDFRSDVGIQVGDQIAKLDENKNSPTQLNKARSGPILKTAWSKYAELRDRSQSFLAAAVIDTLPTSINDEKIDKLGVITNTIEILIQRWDRFQTYFIVFVGLVFDIILIAFFSRHVSSLDDEDEDDFFPYEGAPRKGKIRNLFNE
jgi:hypothetical protein